MGLYEDAERDKDESSVKQMKDDFQTIIGRADSYIDKIVQDRYGDMAKYVSHIDMIKTNLTALKTKYNLPAVDTEIDGYITAVDLEVTRIQARWNTEVYDKLNI